MDDTGNNTNKEHKQEILNLFWDIKAEQNCLDLVQKSLFDFFQSEFCVFAWPPEKETWDGKKVWPECDFGEQKQNQRTKARSWDLPGISSKDQIKCHEFWILFVSATDQVSWLKIYRSAMVRPFIAARFEN